MLGFGAEMSQKDPVSRTWTHSRYILRRAKSVKEERKEKAYFSKTEVLQ